MYRQRWLKALKLVLLMRLGLHLVLRLAQVLRLEVVLRLELVLRMEQLVGMTHMRLKVVLQTGRLRLGWKSFPQMILRMLLGLKLE